MKLFFLHGMGGSASDWLAVQSRLPGKALSIPALGFDEAAEALAQSLRSEPEPFVLCGYSMGGRLAIRVATKLAGSKLRGLVLLAAGLGFADDKSREERRLFDENWAKRTVDKNFWDDWYNQELFASYRALPPEQKKIWMEGRLSLDIEHLSQQFRLLGPGQHGDLTPELLALRKNPISLLYIAGERDKKYSNLAMELQAEGVPTEIVGGGHILPLEAPESVAKSVSRFIARVEKEK